MDPWERENSISFCFSAPFVFPLSPRIAQTLVCPAVHRLGRLGFLQMPNKLSFEQQILKNAGKMLKEK